MKIEYDPSRDLMYLWLGTPGEKAAKTEVVSPGVHADFDRDNRLIGIEITDASEIIREKLQFEVTIAKSADAPA